MNYSLAVLAAATVLLCGCSSIYDQSKNINMKDATFSSEEIAESKIFSDLQKDKFDLPCKIEISCPDTTTMLHGSDTFIIPVKRIVLYNLESLRDYTFRPANRELIPAKLEVNISEINIEIDPDVFGNGGKAICKIELNYRLYNKEGRMCSYGNVSKECESAIDQNKYHKTFKAVYDTSRAATVEIFRNIFKDSSAIRHLRNEEE